MDDCVATVLTAYGIETLWLQSQPLKQILQLQQCLPLTVLKRMEPLCAQCLHSGVATVLTVYGIETLNFRVIDVIDLSLQQCLPFTVLKLTSNTTSTCTTISSCNSAYRLRY